MKKLVAILFLGLSVSVFAQTKPAYSVAEITYINKDIYQRDLWPKIQKLVSESGAEIIVAGSQIEGIAGIPKAVDKVTIIKFKNIQQAKSFYSSKSYQEIKPVADKAINIKLYIVEGQ